MESSIPSADDQTPPVRLTSGQDRQRLMDLLGITSLRPGRNGSNKSDPNYANYDESRANPYLIFQMLVCESGVL